MVRDMTTTLASTAIITTPMRSKANSCNHIVDARELAGAGFDWRKIMAAGVLGGHQAVHGRDPRARVRANTGPLLGRRRSNLRHGARNRQCEHLCHWRRDDHLSVRIDHVRCLTGSGSTILGISPFEGSRCPIGPLHLKNCAAQIMASLLGPRPSQALMRNGSPEQFRSRGSFCSGVWLRIAPTPAKSC